MNEFRFTNTDWQENNLALKQVRIAVFIEEQKVPIELEWDDFDKQSTHFLVMHNDIAIATARLKPDGQIGRMAVVKNYRNKGIGKKLLGEILLFAQKNNYKLVYLHAQHQAVNFYEKFNFILNGVEFMDAGIKHIAMYKLLNCEE